MRFGVREDRFKNGLFLTIFIASLVLIFVLDGYSANYPLISLVDGKKTNVIWLVMGMLLVAFAFPLFALLFNEQKSSLLIGLVFLAIPLIASFFLTVNILNGVLDGSKPNAVDAKVISKKSAGRYSTSYTVTVESKLHKASMAFRISTEFYYLVQPGDSLRLSVKEGWLGDAWISSYEKI